jgi:hypothetical protein
LKINNLVIYESIFVSIIIKKINISILFHLTFKILACLESRLDVASITKTNLTVNLHKVVVPNKIKAADSNINISLEQQVK